MGAILFVVMGLWVLLWLFVCVFENVFVQACSVCMESVFTVCENRNRCYCVFVCENKIYFIV